MSNKYGMGASDFSRAALVLCRFLEIIKPSTDPNIILSDAIDDAQIGRGVCRAPSIIEGHIKNIERILDKVDAATDPNLRLYGAYVALRLSMGLSASDRPSLCLDIVTSKIARQMKNNTDLMNRSAACVLKHEDAATNTDLCYDAFSLVCKISDIKVSGELCEKYLKIGIARLFSKDTGEFYKEELCKVIDKTFQQNIDSPKTPPVPVSKNAGEFYREELCKVIGKPSQQNSDLPYTPPVPGFFARLEQQYQRVSKL